MQLSSAVQESLVILLCYDDTRKGARLVRSLVRPASFDPYYRDIAQQADDYFEKYAKPPGDHTLDIIQALKLARPDSAEIYQRIYESMEAMRGGINAEYVITQAQVFVRWQNLTRATSQIIDQLAQENELGLLEAESIFERARDRRVDLFDPGLRLTDARALNFLDKTEDVFETGIKELDELGLGPARKRFHLLMGLYGKGKTHWLVGCLGKRGLMRGRKVCHVTCEMDEDDVAQRYMSSLFSVTKRKQEVKYPVFKSDELGRFVNFDIETVKDRPAYTDADIRQHLTKEVDKNKRRLGQLIIKFFPTGTLTIAMLKGYLDALEATQNFIPDLLIIDYPDLMDKNPKYEREELGKIYIDLRGIAGSRNMAVAAVTQSNREGEGVKTLGGKQVSGDFSKFATADIVLTYNQTEAENELGLARLYVLKGRTDKDRFYVLLSQAYAMGQFCIDSVKMVQKTYWDFLSSNTSGGTGDEEESEST
jgi:hypothetical protein